MTQPNLFELAKQGDAQVIASLMNRQLQPKGITANLSKIEKLKKLRDQGAISEDEFEAKKRKLLEQL